MDIVKGYITETTDNGIRAKVETFEGEILDDVLMLYPYGTASNIQGDDSSLVLLFKSLGSKTNIFGIPYNVPLQPSLEPSEAAFGNFKKGNKITFKANGDIEVLTSDATLKQVVNELQVDANNKITLSAPEVSIGAATNLALNDAATMQVTIPGGSSAGTYPVTIIAAGQTSVSI